MDEKNNSNLLSDGGWRVGTMQWLKYQAEQIAILYVYNADEAAARLYRVIDAYNRRPQ